jgi:hypothetical protein
VLKGKNELLKGELLNGELLKEGLLKGKEWLKGSC